MYLNLIYQYYFEFWFKSFAFIYLSGSSNNIRFFFLCFATALERVQKQKFVPLSRRQQKYFCYRPWYFCARRRTPESIPVRAQTARYKLSCRSVYALLLNVASSDLLYLPEPRESLTWTKIFSIHIFWI